MCNNYIANETSELLEWDGETGGIHVTHKPSVDCMETVSERELWLMKKKTFNSTSLSLSLTTQQWEMF